MPDPKSRAPNPHDDWPCYPPQFSSTGHVQSNVRACPNIRHRAVRIRCRYVPGTDIRRLRSRIYSIGTGQGPPSPLLANKPVESFEVTRLRGLGRPGLEVIAFHRRGEFRRPAEEAPGFGGVKAGKTGRFEKCGLPVDGLDKRFNWRGRGGDEPEAQVDGR